MTLPTRIAVGLHSGDSEISDLQRAMQAALDAINNVVWIAPTLINGFTNFGVGWLNAGYVIDALGWVHVRGLIINGAGVGANTPAFTLPVGFRPTANSRHATCGEGIPPLITIVDVQANGNVNFPLAVAAGGFRSLDGIIFDTRA